MRRVSAALLIVSVPLLGLLWLVHPVLFDNHQFSFRDIGHYYYPLHKVVQDEWDAGRWPLWELQENAGMPLMGNPTAAVLYPGKLVFGLLSHAWASRLYVLLHVLLALGTMFILLQSWGLSGLASTFGAVSYAFAIPVLFQYCNIIYLVGASWFPLGILGVDIWLRGGRRSGVILLAVALSLMTLGGDPETAYVLGLCAGGYAWGLSRRGRDESGASEPSQRAWAGRVAWIAIGLIIWIVSTLVLAIFRRQFHVIPIVTDVLPTLGRWIGPLIWGAIGLRLIIGWIRRGRISAFGKRTLGLVIAATFAVLVMSAQLLPILEFARLTVRAADQGPHEIYPFSIEPYRIAEWVYPGLYGDDLGPNGSWRLVIPPQSKHKTWVPSLYLGAAAIVLGWGALAFRHGPSPKRWLSLIAVISLLASFGEFTSPLLWARALPASWQEGLPRSGLQVGGPTYLEPTPLETWLGRSDETQGVVARHDGSLFDGVGSLYSLMATILPGFGSFRYPSKLLTIVCFALAGLAAYRLDGILSRDPTPSSAPGAESGSRAESSPNRPALRLSTYLTALLAILGGIGALVLTVMPEQFLSLLVDTDALSRADVRAMFVEIRDMLARDAMVLSGLCLLLGLLNWASRRGRSTLVVRLAFLLLVLQAIDLANVASRHIFTVSQSDMDRTPWVLDRILEAERDDSSKGPYRIHRIPIWSPLSVPTDESGQQQRALFRWEHSTLQAKHGLLHDVNYTYTLGVSELYDYSFFFGSFRRIVNPDVAQGLGMSPGSPIVYMPRRSFDLWNTRYFIVPEYVNPSQWNSDDRGFAALLPQTERIYPPNDDGSEQIEPGLEAVESPEVEDVQIYRNRNALPRAWVVREARFVEPITGLRREDRQELFQEMIYQGDPIWFDPDRFAFDPRRVAWVEANPELQRQLQPHFLNGLVVSTAESDAIAVRYDSPQRVEIDVALNFPGLLILSDVYYPGWHLEIDGEPAEILRVNRVMRGAAVEAGRHHLVYTYDPLSFRLGLGISLFGLAALAVAVGVVWRWPCSRFETVQQASPEDS